MTETNKTEKQLKRDALRAANGQGPATPPATEAPPTEESPIQRLAALAPLVATNTASLKEINEYTAILASLNQVGVKASETKADKACKLIRETFELVADDLIEEGFTTFSVKLAAASPAINEVKDGDKVVTEARAAVPRKIDVVLSTTIPRTSPGTNGNAKRESAPKTLAEAEREAYILRHSTQPPMTYAKIGEARGVIASTANAQYTSAKSKIDAGAEAPEVNFPPAE